MNDRLTNTATNRLISVCFISLDAYPLFSRKETSVQGGAEVDIYMLSTELSKDKKFKVSLITGDYGQDPVEQIEDITIYKTADLRNPAAAALSIWKAMSRANADIYFKKGASSIAALVALYCRLHRRSLFLRTAADIDCDGTYIRENWLRGRAFLWALKQARQVFVQKDSNKASLKETTGVSAVVLPNGHRILELSSQKRDCILWVGRSTRYKQPELFIKLAQETPDEQFVMICPQSKDDNKYDDLVAGTKTVANLKFIEGVPFHEIDSFFQRAKVFVNTSSMEGFPNTFIQACRCATPILSLKINPDHFLDKHRCGMCANGDWNLFAAMLKQLLNTEIATKLGNNGRIYAKENHDVKKIIEQYKSIFEKRLSG
jgi:glycosyltransferase involved in cell wall biosynthesis